MKLVASYFLLFASLFASVHAQAAYTFNPYSLTKYNVFAKTPKNKEQIQTGGRLIDRHIGYLYEAGFKSVLSISEFATNDTSYNGVSGNFPSSDYEMTIIGSYGMNGKYTASALTVDSAYAISKLIDEMPKPLYMHCHVGYSANLFLQLHFYINNQISAESIYADSLLLGYDYQSNSDIVNLINAVTGRSDSVAAPKIEAPLADGEQSYRSYYWTHRLGESDYWYNAGQILSTHVDAINSAGYKIVLNYRADGEATARLPSEPTTGPIPNYEFSDVNGNYNLIEEETAFRTKGLKYYHLPLVSGSASTWSKEQFFEYLPTLQEVSALNLPVLVHCASGYRSSAFTLTFLAYQSKYCSDWVFSHAKDVGFVFNSENPTSTDVAVVSFVKDVLNC